MKTRKYTLIKARFNGTELYGGTGRARAGDILVMFPYSSFVDKNAAGKKTFKSIYVKLNDLHLFPEFRDVRDDFIANHPGIDPDTYGKMTVTWRR